MPRPGRQEWRPRRRRHPSPRTPCPHCGRLTPTVRGACTECWGPKDATRRLFTIKKRGPHEPADPLRWVPGCLPWPVLAVATLLALTILRGWT